MNLYSLILKELKSCASAEKAVQSASYFKAEKGGYGEGDIFIGVTVPQQRAIAKKYKDQADKKTIEQLLDARIHEERLTGLYLLIFQFDLARKKNNEQQWVDLFLQKIDRVNNWDLVDSSAHLILGKWLEDKKRDILYEFAQSNSLWRNRIAIITTKHFIKHNDFEDLFAIAIQFLTHPHDLVHKATGWMLREAWEKDPIPVEDFLEKNKNKMPRTMLRYAIEKMPEEKRKQFLRKDE